MTSPFATLRALLSDARQRLWRAYCIVAVAVLMELVPYYLLWRASEPNTDLLRLALVLLAALLGKYLLLTLAGYFSHLAAFDVLYRTRLKLATALTRLPLAALAGRSNASVRNIIMNDVERLEQFIAHHSVDMVAALISPLTAALFLFWIDWGMALAALATVPLAIIAQKLFSRGMQARTEAYHQASTELDSALVEYVRGIPVMKAFQQSVTAFRLLDQRMHRYHQLVESFTRRAVPAWSVFVVLLNANLFILLPFGLWRVAQGSLSVTQLVLTLMLGSGLLKPLLRITFLGTLLREIFAGVARIAPLLVEKPPQTLVAMPTQYDLQADAVSFSYKNTPVLQGIRLQLPAGQFYAMVGTSGSGKSTLASLLAGLHAPSSGLITLGGQDLSRFSDAQRASMIALVTQEVFLFKGTLADNLRIGNPQASESQLWQALRLAQAERWVALLPQQLQTPVGERGVTLSGGEQQRIAIARALLANTAILILDEATAFADALTEAAFYRDLRSERPTMSVLSIAHRLYAVQQADQLLVMEHGELVAQGTHQMLLKQNSTYRSLWEQQFALAKWHIRAEGESDVIV